MLKDFLEKVNNKYNDLDKQVLKYLENKYGEKFEIIGTSVDDYSISGGKIGVRPKQAEPNLEFRVFANFSKGKINLSDSYYSVLTFNKYDKLIKSVVASVVSDASVKCYVTKEGENPTELKRNSPLETAFEFLKPDKPVFYSKILISFNKANGEDLALTICKKIKELKLASYIQFLVVSKKLCYIIDSTFAIKKIDDKLISHSTLKTVKSEKSLSVWQMERLAIIIYLSSIIENADLGNLGDILTFIKYIGLNDSKINGKYPCLMTETQWLTVINDILEDDHLKSLEIIKYIDVNEINSKDHPEIMPGHRAICFMDSFQNGYVVFRGTSGDYEWYDSALGMIYSDTTNQKASKKFIESLWEEDKFDFKNLFVVGHSKGGNKAQYATITTKEGYVNGCVSIDGQGFSSEFINKYNQEINSKKHLITLIAEQRDYVNCLGFYLKETIFYRGFRGDKTKSLPFGYSLKYFHCPDGLRDFNSEPARSFFVSYMAKAINEYIVFFLSNPKYASIREDTVLDLISVITVNDSVDETEIVEAFNRLVKIMFDFLYCNSAYKNDIITLMENEKDVFFATIKLHKKSILLNNFLKILRGIKK